MIIPPIDPPAAPAWPTLIAQVRAGEAGSWESLFAVVRPWAQARLAGRVRDFHAREDLVQEILVTLCRRLDTLREPERFPGWFCALVDNAAHGWGRRRQAQLRLEDALLAQGPAADATVMPRDFAADAAEDGRRARLAAAFRALSRDHQTVMRDRYLAGHSYATIAGLLALPEGRVRGRLQKARQQLKLHLENMNLVPEIHELTAADLATLGAAALFTLHDAKHPALAGVCLEPGGRVVATDGRRIVFRKVAALAGLTRRIVLGPCRPELFACIGGGRLEVELSRLRFEDIGGRQHEWPLIVERDFPPVDQVLPASWAAGLRFRVAALRGALAGIEPLLAGRHPARAEFPYSPIIRLRVRPAEGCLLLETDRRLGYAGADADIESAFADEPAWRHAVELRASATNGAWPDAQPERIVGLNADYLRESLSALELGPTDEVWLRWQGAADTAAGVESAGDAAQLALVMPVRLTD